MVWENLHLSLYVRSEEVYTYEGLYQPSSDRALLAGHSFFAIRTAFAHDF